MCTNALNRHRNIHYMLDGKRWLSLSVETISHMAIMTEGAGRHSLVAQDWHFTNAVIYHLPQTLSLFFLALLGYLEITTSRKVQNSLLLSVCCVVVRDLTHFSLVNSVYNVQVRMDLFCGNNGALCCKHQITQRVQKLFR